MRRSGASLNTYGRSNQEFIPACNRDFDSMMAQDSKPSIAKAAPRVTKWGNTSFTSSRNSNYDDSETKRRKLDTSKFMDPEMDNDNDVFSFEPDSQSGKNFAKSRPKMSSNYSSSFTGVGTGLKMRVSRDPFRSDSDPADYIKEEKPVVKPTKYKFFRSKKKAAEDDVISLDSNGSDSGYKCQAQDNISVTSVDSLNNSFPTTTTTIPSTTDSVPVKKSKPSIALFGFETSDPESDDNATPDCDEPIITSVSAPKRTKVNREQNLHSLSKLFEDEEVKQERDDWELLSNKDSKAGIVENYSRKYGKNLNAEKNPRGSLQKRLSNKLIELEREKSNVGSLKKNGSGSFTRRLLMSPKKKTTIRAVYNPRQWGEDEEVEDDDTSNDSTSVSKHLSSHGSSKTHNKLTPAFINPLTHDFDDDEKPQVGPTPRCTYVTNKPVDNPVFKRVNRKNPNSRGDAEMVSALKVSREHKPLFTVVHNVKQAHEVQEHGENQEFLDDMEYIMDGIPDTETPSVRCLSTMSLVHKCTEPSFRMHLRAHDIITKVFSALHNAPEYPTLALCTAGVMFMCSRDHLTMDLDKPSLHLMLQLLSSSDSEEAMSPNKGQLTATQKELRRLHAEICKACEVVKKNGSAKHLNINDISTGSLAMEALLSLTSKRAGDWFKEELRSLGGLDHLVNTVEDCLVPADEEVNQPGDDLLCRFKKIERCLRVLENVTYMNVDNQNHLIMYKSNALIDTLALVLRICDNCLTHNPVQLKDNKPDQESVGYIIMSCMLASLRVLINLTHDSALGCNRTGQQTGMVNTVLNVLFKLTRCVPESEVFDILVLCLGLLINLVDHFDGNKHKLLDCVCSIPSITSEAGDKVPALVALLQLFLVHYKDAIRAENEVEQNDPKNGKQRPRLQKKSSSQGSKRGGPPMSEMRRKLLEQQDSDPSALLPGRDKIADASGEWRESDSGIEWVSNTQTTDGSDLSLDTGANSNLDQTTSDLCPSQTEVEASDTQKSGEESDGSDFDIMASQENDESFTKALHKAGRHMEDSIVAAYTSLLIGCLIENNIDLVKQIRDLLEDGNFEPMIYMLRKFLKFMDLITATNNTGAKTIQRIIETLEAC